MSRESEAKALQRPLPDDRSQDRLAQGPTMRIARRQQDRTKFDDADQYRYGRYRCL